MKPQLKVELGGYSHEGIKPVNQDAFAGQNPKGLALEHKGVALAIADGVSSSARSQEAAQISVTQFITDYYATPDSWSVNKSSARVLTALNSWLFNENHKTQEDALVCTFSALVIKSCTAHIFHIGDSRVYRLEKDKLHCLTRDHVHPSKKESVLIRALGIDNHLEVDYHSIDDLKAGDMFILTTDGFHHFVTAEQITQALLSHTQTLAETAEQLVKLAIENGSDDNVSCFIVKINELPHEDVDEAHRRLTKLVIPPVLEVGQSIDGYKVCRVLFSGTRSHVFLVEDEQGKQYALKMPSENFREDPEYLDGFLREEWIGNRLSHRNIMRIFPRPENSPFMYHLCEYLGGQNLRQWIADNPKPSLDEVRKIMTEVVQAMRFFQRNGMVHRDLKPENVIIDKFGQIKVIDFGTVSVEGLEEISSPINETCPVGSVDYIAPEYLMGQKGNFQADLYSIGMMFYEMLAGKIPFKIGDLRNKIPKNYHYWRYESLLIQRPDMPKWIDVALEKACQPDPNLRYTSFSEFLADIATPNQNLMRKHEVQPLIKRDPLQFWRGISLVLLLTHLIWLYLLLNPA
ncbi:bifunctional protein-serine/threonine kinase/phosphatase [Catenovulum sp. 2E275]|uniref:bifunctional protein-serine/threonine kinase/phosphatase n=1 Tax=Catenovulum sp. 2E275 TaxID=2980497 RepID=UPI0021D320F5|nr:bifunctional protein-serine/threonine kinase/phosphatase [Catenovulum sp. 2E275]MCU4675970.1 bifunctional protein-serine/threonine kinase/phosphatase [Catenovulum sp. 2E275]